MTKKKRITDYARRGVAVYGVVYSMPIWLRTSSYQVST